MFNVIRKIVWVVASVMLFFCGIYYTVELKVPQLNKKYLKKSFQKRKDAKMTPFKILTMTLAGRIGVGSLSGIAIALCYGGVGSLFWVWISCFITASLTFVESFLAVHYKEKDGDHSMGGPSFYIDKGLHKKKLAKFYAILILLSYFVGFLTIQANTISVASSSFFPISKFWVGIFLTILTFFFISKGLDSIAAACSKLVPLMGLFYFLFGLFILKENFSLLPSLFLSILKEAFHIKEFGIGMFSTMIIGIQRGIFSNEAGLGTAAIASGTCEDDNAEGQGMLQVLGVYFTSFVICTITAFVILTSDYQTLSFQDINGIELIQYAFTYHLGSFGNIFLFVLSTIITVYYYGESNLKYILTPTSKMLLLLKISMAIFLLYGSMASPSILWNIVDIFVALLAIINIYSIFELRGKVKEKLRSTYDRKSVG